MRGRGKDFPAPGRCRNDAATIDARPMGSRRIALLLFSTALACRRPLPAADSPAARLYERRCGACHGAYAPGSLKFALWETVLPRMEQRMAQAGQPPLGAEERRAILDYLREFGG